MKISDKIFIVLLAITIYGCATPPSQKVTMYPEYLAEKTVKEEPINKSTPRVVTSPELRQQYVIKLGNEYNEILKSLTETLDNLKERADKRTGLTLGTGIAGIAAGIAAAALTVASPANAVWVTGLTGFGTGVITFQTSLGLEGLSRVTVVNIHTEIIKNMQTAEKEFLTKYEVLLKKINGSDNEWDNAAAEAAVSLKKLASTTVYIPLTIGKSEDLKALESQQSKMQEEINKIKEKLPQEK